MRLLTLLSHDSQLLLRVVVAIAGRLGGLINNLELGTRLELLLLIWRIVGVARVVWVVVVAEGLLQIDAEVRILGIGVVVDVKQESLRLLRLDHLGKVSIIVVCGYTGILLLKKNVIVVVRFGCLLHQQIGVALSGDRLLLSLFDLLLEKLDLFLEFLLLLLVKFLLVLILDRSDLQGNPRELVVVEHLVHQLFSVATA